MELKRKKLYSVTHDEDAKLKVLSVHAVRWLGLGDCSRRFLRVLPYLIAALEDGKQDALQNAKATVKLTAELLASLRDPVNIALLCALTGVVQVMWTLSKGLQFVGLSPEQLIIKVYEAQRQVRVNAACV